MRKRFSAAMALALSCAMVLTACSGGSKPAETTAAAAAAVKHLIVRSKLPKVKPPQPRVVMPRS